MSNQLTFLTMSLNPIAVFRLDLPLDGATFDGLMHAQSDFKLAIHPAHGADDAAWQALQGAHIYHVSSAKDDLPQPWFVNEALLKRCPQLLEPGQDFAFW